jgi:hypothetical protein
VASWFDRLTTRDARPNHEVQGHHEGQAHHEDDTALSVSKGGRAARPVASWFDKLTTRDARPNHEGAGVSTRVRG